MRFPVAPAPHLPPRVHVGRIMAEVLLALLPGLAALAFRFGPGVLIQCLITLVAAELAEAAALRLRGRPVWATLRDGSAALTAVLLAVSLPPLAPWWLGAFGAVFAILIGKQVYGGLGYNPFNPAMTGYAMLLISFPRPMTAWLPPLEWQSAPLDFAAAWAAIWGSEAPAPGLGPDALAMATPLDLLKTGLAQHLSLDQIRAGPLFSGVGGAGWDAANLGFLVGGLWLLARRRVDWRIPAGFLGALSAASFVAYLADPAGQPTPLFQLFSGATMLGAFFIASDPVSAATTPRGRLLFGAGAGLLVFVIRAFGGYPDGVAFAVLLMNLAAPTLDHYTRPRVFGAPR